MPDVETTRTAGEVLRDTTIQAMPGIAVQDMATHKEIHRGEEITRIISDITMIVNRIEGVQTLPDNHSRAINRMIGATGVLDNHTVEPDKTGPTIPIMTTETITTIAGSIF